MKDLSVWLNFLVAKMKKSVVSKDGTVREGGESIS